MYIVTQTIIGDFGRGRAHNESRTAQLAHLRLCRGRHNVSGHFGRTGGCQVVGFSVPFEVSFTFFCGFCGGGRKQRQCFVNHLHSPRLVCCWDRFGDFVASRSTNDDPKPLPRDYSDPSLIIPRFSAWYSTRLFESGIGISVFSMLLYARVPTLF